MIERPKPSRKYLPLEQLTFDPRLQMRADLLDADGKPAQLFDEATAADYAADLEDGDHFPPLTVVADGVRNWVSEGFHRGEAYRRRGVGSIECDVYPGTFEDARLWALSANGHQPRPRSAADVRRAFDTLLGDEKLLGRVLAGAKTGPTGHKGVQRAIGRACGISKGVVGKYLADVGLRADRKTGKLVPVEPDPGERLASPVINLSPRHDRPGPPPPRPADHPAAGDEPLDVPIPAGSPAPSADPTELAAVDLDRMQRTAATLQKQFDALTAGPLQSLIIRQAARHKVPLARLEGLSAAGPIGEGPRAEVLFAWEPLRVVQAVLADAAAALVNSLYDRRAVV